MARVKFNPLVASVSGVMGEFVIKNRGGKSYLARRPDLSKRVLTPAQKDSINRFRSAVSYAKTTMKDPIALESYREKARKAGIPVYNMIISEYMKEDQAKAKETLRQPGAALPVLQDVPEKHINKPAEEPDPAKIRTASVVLAQAVKT